MKVTNLSSGSKGNCTFVSAKNTKLLVDVGIGIKLLQSSLNQLGENLETINAVLISHEHSDHVCGLESVVKKYPDLHIYVLEPVWKAMVKKCSSLANCQNVHLIVFETGFSVGDLTVVAIENYHDSEACASFILSDGGGKLGICTDLGIITEHQVDMFSTCKVVFLECNHDKKMLSQCEYPKILKQRISGTFGHLSNEQCASAALKMVQNQTKVIVLSHISENSNLPEVAYSCVANLFEQNNIKNVHLLLSYPKKVGKTITIN